MNDELVDLITNLLNTYNDTVEQIVFNTSLHDGAVTVSIVGDLSVVKFIQFLVKNNITIISRDSLISNDGVIYTFTVIKLN